MSNFSSGVCSDEELLEELRKLGYNDVSSDVIDLMKNDLNELIDESPTLDYELNSLSDQHLLATENKKTRKTKNKSRSQKLHSVKAREASNSDSTISDYKSPKTKSKSYTAQEQPNEVDDSLLHSVKAREATNSDSTIYEYKSLKTKCKSYTSHEQPNEVDGNLCETSFIHHDSKVTHKVNNNFSSTDSLVSLSELGRDMDSVEETRPKILLNDNSFKEDCSDDKSDASPKFVYKNINNIKKTSKKGRKTCYDKSPIDSSFKYDYSFNKSSNDQKSMHKCTTKTAFKNKETGYNGNTTDSFGSKKDTSTSSLYSSDVKTMKRKVLRRRNGQSVITEEILKVPSLFETSYPADSDHSSITNKSNSSDDFLSPKSNSSTGSISAISPETSLKSSMSSVSVISTRTSLRIPNSRKKKSDPVAMYNYYKKFWNNYKPPGENTHDKLRWAVRDRMLEYNI